MRRLLRAVLRTLAATLLAVVLAGVPIALVLGIGLPLPTLGSLRDGWTAERVDADLALRIGTLVFVVLWVWFAATALAELWRVMAWKRNPARVRLAPVPPGPNGWIRSLVRFVAISSVSAGALLASVSGAVRPVAAASASSGAAVRPTVALAMMSSETLSPSRPSTVRGADAHVHRAMGRETPFSLASGLGDPDLRARIIELNVGRVTPAGTEWNGGVFPEGMEVLLPGAATVMTPLGPAHEVEAGDCYWDVADTHLTALLEREPTPNEVWTYTETLMDVNHELLGHEDPSLIRPGELIVLTPVEGTSAAPPIELTVEPEFEAPGFEPPEPTEATEAPEPTAATEPTSPPEAPEPTEAPEAAPAASTSPGGAAAEAPVVVVQEGDVLLPFLSGVGTATLLAAGGLGVLEARRRHQLRTAVVGARLEPPSSIHVETERVLRSLGAAERMARLDVALRSAAPQVAAQGAVITGAILGPSGEVRLLLHGAAAPTDEWWRLDLADGSWHLGAQTETAELAPSASERAHPCPGLVHLGLAALGDVFVDLEAVGVLTVDSPHATDVLRAMAVGLDLSPFVESARVATVGLPAAGGDGRTDELDTLDAALEAAAVAMGSTRAVARGRSTFALRVGGVGGEAWEPVLVIAAGDHPADALAMLSSVAHPFGGLGVAVAADHPIGSTGWMLRADGEHHTLLPLGLEVRPVGVGEADVAALRDLLDAGDEIPVRAAPAVSMLRVESSVPFEEPDWSLLVRVFGQVEVVDRDGVAADFERSKALELVVWLSQHRERPTRQGARTALWDLSVRDATFANVVSDARRAMARTVTPPDGEEWIARTLTEDLPLHPGVISDAELVRLRVRHARGCRAQEAIDVLRPAVDLLAGMPFVGTGYLWCDAEGVSSALALAAVEAAGTMAEHCLTMGDTEGVFWATGQGLKVIGGHEALIELRMRAHARRGDLAGVRHEWESYERALAADAFLAPEPSPKMVALRRELLTPSLAG